MLTMSSVEQEQLAFKHSVLRKNRALVQISLGLPTFPQGMAPKLVRIISKIKIH
jgi:hypothetical protein